MSNFIVFRFCDNDFHSPLIQSIRFLVDNPKVFNALNEDSLHNLVILGMLAFDALRRVSRGGSNSYEYEKYREYFNDNLSISEVKNLNDITRGFEGCIYDKHVNNVYYYAN